MNNEIQNTGMRSGTLEQRFETTEANGLHFFQCKTAAGTPMLFSQPYQTAGKRDQAVEALRKYLAVASHYAVIESHGQYFFVIKTGNHKEIARSHPYKTAAECRKSMKAFQAEWKEKKGKEEEEISLPVEMAHPHGEDATAPSHYRFTLSFYPDKTDNRLRGKIEYPLVKEDKESFEGIDLDRIGRFIEQRLPKPEMSKVQITKKAKPAVPSIPASLPLEIIENGKIINSKQIERGKTVEVALPLPIEDIKDLEGKNYKASLSIKSLDGQTKALHIEERGILRAGMGVGMMAPAQHLQSGIYRFTLHASIEDPSDLKQVVEWQGSSLIMLN